MISYIYIYYRNQSSGSVHKVFLMSRHVSCGRAHTGAVTCDGEVFMWGCAHGGRLGLGTSMQDTVVVPTFVKSLALVRVATVGVRSTYIYISIYLSIYIHIYIHIYIYMRACISCVYLYRLISWCDTSWSKRISTISIIYIYIYI